MKALYLISFFSLFLIPLRAQEADTTKFKSLEPPEFREAMKDSPNHLLIDVREFFEYKKSRIKGAVNIPSSGNLEFSVDTIDRSKGLFLYCTSGFRSKRVAKYFVEKGFSDVYSLDGGITGWRKEGYPLEKKRLKRK
jgi:rhodanese-related sulfurtransferase